MKRAERKVVIHNKYGLHVRPSTAFAETAKRFRSRITVKAAGRTVDGKSLIDLLGLGLLQGAEMHIVAEGPDAEEAIEALSKLVDEQFGVEYE